MLIQNKGSRGIYINKLLIPLVVLLVFGAEQAFSQVSGRVYREFNMNGKADAAVSNTFSDKAGNNATSIQTRYAEVGIPGVTITVYGDNEQILGTATTNATGSWTVTVPGSYTATNVIVECQPPASLAFLQTGPFGNDNSTTVARVAKTATNVNFTFGLGSEHAQDNPDLAMACFALPNPSVASGSPGTAEPMVIRFPYNSGGPLTNGTRASTTAGSTGLNYYSATEYPGSPSKQVLTTFGQTGTVYGVTYDKRRNRLFTSAFERAYTGIGAAGAGGEGRIYVTTLAASGSAVSTTTWLDLESALSANVAGIDPAITGGLNFVSSNVTVSYFEHNKIGHISLGDLEMSPDGKTVYVVNLYSKEIYGIPLNADGTPNTAGIKTFTPPSPCASGSFSTDPASPAGTRPYNALLGLGVHPETGRVYCTVTCTGPSSASMSGTVYSFDPGAATPAFTNELQIPLNFTFQTGDDGTEGSYANATNDAWTTMGNNTVVTNNYSDHTWMADIAFDIEPDGTTFMIVGGRNRFMDATSGSRITHGQGLWLAAQDGSSWVLENNGVAGDRTTANTLTLPWFSVRNGNGVFFNTNGSEGADGTGNIAAIPGFTEVALAGVDNIKSAGNSGITFMKRSDGTRTRDILLLGSLTNGGTAPRGEVYKANLWGEVEALLEPAPLEIGNYVFEDVNKNGIQDPSDLPLAGVTVSLIKDTNNDGLPNETAIASTTTNASGQYYFDRTDGLDFETQYIVVVNKTTDFSTGVLKNKQATTADVSSNSKDSRDSDGKVISGGTGVYAVVVTGIPGENNHKIDFGFITDIAAITVTSTNVCSGGTALLNATGCSGTVTWSDGTTGNTLTTPALTQLTTYTATCTTAGGSTTYAVGAVSVSPLPVITIQASATNVNVNTPVSLTASGCAGGTLQWSTGSSLSVISVTPTNPSNVYSATCITGQGCKGSVSVTITTGPPAVIGVNAATICYGTTATLSSTGCLGAIIWSTGATTSSITTPALTQTTSYTATCTTSTSSTSVVATVTVMPQPVLSLQASSTNVTVGTPVSLSAIGCVGTVAWSTGGSGSTISVTPTQPMQTYSATCTTGPGCTTTASIIVNSMTPDVVPDLLTVCSGSSATLTASGCNNGTVTWSNGTTGNSLITPNLTQTTSYTATCTTQAGSATLSVSTVAVLPPVSLTVSRTSLSGATSVTVSARGCSNGTLTWSTGSADNGKTSIIVPANVNSPYTVTCVSGPGCVATGRIFVGSGSGGTNEFTVNDALICSGQSATLITTACAGTVSWLGSGIAGQTTSSVIVNPAQTTAYTAICTNGSTALEAEALVTVTSAPGLTLAASSLTVLTGQSVTLTVAGCQSGTLNWSTGSVDDGKTSIVISPTATTAYSVTCIAGPQCVGTAPITITVGQQLVPQLNLKKLVSKSKGQIGDVVSYTVILYNTGSGQATNTVVRDSISTGAVIIPSSVSATVGTFGLGTPVSSWSVATLPANATATLTFSASLTTEGIAYNTAKIPGITETVCTSVPYKVCKGSTFSFELEAPAGFTSYQWLKNGIQVYSGPLNSFTATETGEYAVTVDNVPGLCPGGSCCPVIIEADSIPVYTAQAKAPTCIANQPNSDGTITLFGLGSNPASYSFAISQGTSFTATNPVVQAVPANGVIATNLAGDRPYVVRVYNAPGCFRDVRVDLVNNCQCPAEICVPVTIRKTKSRL
ncbi:SdrD B-like domain-containing protein [Arsenicibacter rosenii]|uniref:DUF11 domain-containing protein n=1 Tax=Arsenicibacter rosenii TaxID=1750698 RepID=A0A1S2VPE0_9BACT|nr:SdrD B-like domain-containing protein [Arsenicibacter rosenii]OIN60612.1 hypothetical protein BLX24_00365 [Arsenicibacter rosenii]